MDDRVEVLNMRFDGSESNRAKFLKGIRTAVIELTKEVMTLDFILYEIAKNIFDHAGGVGSLIIWRTGHTLEFVIKDGGCSTYDFATCIGNSRLCGNGVNFGLGLSMIVDGAKGLGINLHIDTSNGFSYQGVYELGGE